MECDAIVNAANPTLLGGGGVDGAIHRAAGPGLLAECKKLGGCKTGEAKITRAYRLPCKYVIHTVGPIWRGGDNHEEEKLVACYRNSLELAKEYKCESVAFPLISSGAYGYPREEALQVAVSEIGRFLMENEMLVYLVVFDKACFCVSKKLIRDVAEYIDENYVEEHTQVNSARSFSYPLEDVWEDKAVHAPAPRAPGMFKRAAKKSLEATASLDLSDVVLHLDESFSQMLLRKIDEKGMTDAACYKKANVDRKLFSKIRNNPQYKPKKTTVLAFAVALELSLDETNEMLMKSGYALSHSSKFDVIIEYFIKKREYNIFTINEALFEFDQVLLG
jgi:O-acetyl-ADP-ribose deacetylase (regulator of RNase III)